MGTAGIPISWVLDSEVLTFNQHRILPISLGRKEGCVWARPHRKERLPLVAEDLTHRATGERSFGLKRTALG